MFNKLFEKIESNSILLLIVFILISFAVFFPTYFNLDFFWDDERFIFSNPSLMQAPDLLSFWNVKSDFYKSWPLGYSIFWALIKTFPEISIGIFKTINIVFHGLNGWLVHKLLKQLNFKYTILPAIIFLIHPLHVETVSWIFQLLTILSFTFFILSFIYLLKFLDESKKMFYVLSFVLFVFSIWTKSIAILAPFLYFVILWTKKSRLSKYAFLIPFFIASFYIGMVNLKGTAYLTQSSEVKQYPKNSFFNVIDESVKTIMPDKTKKIKADEYYTYLYPEDRKNNNIEFNSIKIFKQGITHYTLKAIAPFNLKYIYMNVDYGFLATAAALIILIILPFFLLYRSKDRYYLLIPSFSVIFLGPYLGITFITFFYWSHVSDRYTYFFLLTLVFVISYIHSRYNSHAKNCLLIYVSFLYLSSVNYGLIFNNPLEMYKELINQKSHPALYSLLFEQYLQRGDAENAGITIKEGIKLFPKDELLKNDLFRLEALEKTMNHKLQ